MASRSLTIDIRTADAQTIAALKKIQKELRDTGTTADRTSRSGLSLGDALGGLAIGAGLGVAIGEFEEAETTARKTAAAIESTGNAAGISAEQQAKMVDELSKLAAVDDEVVAGGANILRTFTQVRGDAFEPALAAALDLSAALGTDLQSATLQVGKALNDPVKGVTALTRAGVSFTAQQKEQIKAMVAAGDTAGAQKLILQELETQFGGQAEAAVTDSAKMRVAFADAAESLGGALAPALSAAADGAQVLSAKFQGLPQPVQQVGLGLGALAIVGPKVAHGFNEIREATTNAEGATTRMGKALGAAGIGAAAAAGVFALNEYRKATSGLKVDIDALLSATDEAIAAELQRIAAAGLLKQNDLEEVGRQNVDALYAMRDALKANGEDALPQLDAAIKVVEAEQERAAARADRYAAAQAGAGDAAAGAAPKHHDLADAIGQVNGVLAGSYTEGVRANQAFAAYLQSSLDVNAAVVDVAEAQEAAADAADAVADAERGVQDASESVADARRGVADAEAAVADAREGVVEATERVTEAEEAAADAAAAVVEAQEAVAQAQRDAQIDSDYMADALQRVTDAEEGVQQAQEDSLAAQQALDAARANYSQTLADLKDNAAGAADDVLSAEIRLRDAQRNLAELGRDGKPVTADERLAAEIAIREAERRLRDAQQRAAEAQEDLNRNQRDGVEGSDAVVEAQDAVTAAADRQADAQATLEEAVQNVADTQTEALGRVEAAQATLTEKIDARADADQAVVDARQGVVDANDAVAKAVQGVADAHGNVSKASDGVLEAQKRYAEAKDAAITAQREVEAAVKAVREALDVQATSWAGVLTEIKFDGALRTAIRGISGELRTLAGNYDVNVNLGGNAAGAILSGVSNPFLDVLAAVLGVQPTVPQGGRSTDGPKSSSGSASSAPVVGPSVGGKAEVHLHMHDVQDPAAVWEIGVRRAGWEITRLIGSAA